MAAENTETHNKSFIGGDECVQNNKAIFLSVGSEESVTDSGWFVVWDPAIS